MLQKTSLNANSVQRQGTHRRKDARKDNVLSTQPNDLGDFATRIDRKILAALFGPCACSTSAPPAQHLA